MSLTVGKLKEFLSSSPDDHVITNEQNQNFIHIIAGNSVIISTKKPIGICCRSGEYVYESVVDGYTAYSPALDEDLYDVEWEKLDRE